MLYVDRSRFPVPKAFAAKAAQDERERARAFFARPAVERLQERFDFKWPDLRARTAILLDLRELFHGKCAFCEQTLSLDDSHFVGFRPSNAPQGLIPPKVARTGKISKSLFTQGDANRDHYWWLTFEWRNYYPTCKTCEFHKGNQFPVIGTRAPLGATEETLRSEIALLLDPCHDHPEVFFRYNEDGRIESRGNNDDPKFHGLDRGQVTIDLFALNRPELMVKRRRASVAFRQLRLNLGRSLPLTKRAFFDAFVEVVNPAAPFSGMGKQFLADAIQDLSAEEKRLWVHHLGEYWDNLVDLAGLPHVTQLGIDASSRRRIKARKKKGKAHPKRRPQTDVAPVGFLRKIVIEDFKAIRALTIEMPEGGTNSRMGWKVLLGENGTGKSSILLAVALTLMGSAYIRDYLRTFRLKPSDLLRKVRGSRTVSRAQISLEFSVGKRTVLEFTSRAFRYLEDPPQGVFLRAFGATRLLPRRNAVAAPVRTKVLAKIDSLCDPATPVFDAIRWLAGLKNRREFGSAALTLKDLLDLPGMSKLQRVGRRVQVPVNGLKHWLDELSAGYESVFVMATDIIAGHIGQLQDISHATGLVLLDEIDAHLHPRWKQRIVASLRRAFPTLQFIVTTHEPLCLRGVEKGEVAVLERYGNEVAMLTDLPNPSSMRVDQILTSNFFGLGSTIDPEVETRLTRYYELLAKPQAKLSKNEAAECAWLRSQVAQYEPRLMADSPRMEILLEAIDNYIAKDAKVRGTERAELPALRDKTKARVAKVWFEGADRPPPPR